MKIEKVSDKQIRCTLTAADLVDFNMKFSELAYGTEGARALFREMMNKAHEECGFDASGGPLMIEAVPTGSGALTLIITRVDDPEELDTRFAKFSPDSAGKVSGEIPSLKGADDIIDFFSRKEAAPDQAARKKRFGDSLPKDIPSKDTAAGDMIRMFTFKDLDTVITAAGILSGNCAAINTLYRAGGEDSYYLIVHKASLSPEDFNRLCNTLSEYGSMTDCSASRETNLSEHARLIVKDQALQTLSMLNS